MSAPFLLGRTSSSWAGSRFLGGLLRPSASRRLFAPAPGALQYRNLDRAASRNFLMPHAGEEGAVRPFQGMDMRKIHQFPWVNYGAIKAVRDETGYFFGGWQYPSVHAMTRAEVATYFTLKDWQRDYSLKEKMKAVWPICSFHLQYLAALVVSVAPCLVWVYYLQKFEPLEVHMPADEFFKDYRLGEFKPWHQRQGNIGERQGEE
eukprot:GHVT01102047.1.p1 GENE.GHVT01102047.1~~GHVT01102047.1.p1  ORF type:complete len:205 (+),score=33.57 GHVT01102047.1:183-797(+)